MLDTKLKNSHQSRAFGVLFSLLILAFISACIIASYPLLRKNTQLMMKNEKSKRETMLEEDKEKYKSYFIKTLLQSNYVLSWSNIEQNADSSVVPSQIFLTKDLQEISYSDDFYLEKEAFVDQFNNVMEEWYYRFYFITLKEYASFQYYLVDHKSGNTLTNTIKPLSLLQQDTAEAQKLRASYPFYIVFQYGEDGSLQILDYAGLDQAKIDEYKLMELNKTEIQDDLDNWHQYKDRVKPPSDVTIIYASNLEEFYLSDNMKGYLDPQYYFSEAGFLYAYSIAFVCVFLLAMLLPLKKSWKIGSGLAARIPMEISLAGIMVSIAFYGGMLPMAWETITGYFICNPEYTIIPRKLLNVLDYCVNYIAWMAVLVILYLCFLSIRQVFTLGLIRYLKEKTLTGRMLRWLIRKIKKLFRSLGEIDLSEPSNKYIMKVLAVNFVILLILCSIWFLGIAILIPYTILLFFIIKRYMDDIKKKYAILLKATSKIADGNLEGTIEEDLGVFNPLKDELTKVQRGFKIAVEEEIKSQRLKTDLITNVSHDLKTPLTAIITYINLLKEENISEEDRKSYIKTLDNKSQRLKRLIEDLFEVSKASSNNVTINLVEVDLVNLIQQVLLELDDKIVESEVEFRFHPPVDKVVLFLDSEKTYRIFENLIINITKYAMPHSRAYIDITREKDIVKIILKNVSISELEFNSEEISERFVRGDQARNTEGSGLGLAIVKSFVELQGGKFRIQTDGDLFKAMIQWKVINKDNDDPDKENLLGLKNEK